MNSIASSHPEARGRGSFPTTHWSVVVNAGAGSESEARAALEILCRQYWYPLYSYIRRQGRSHHDAEDCTQAFFARLLANDSIARARPARGRFRTFLLTALRNFLINEWHRAQAEKRGGGATHVPLDLPADAAERFAREPPDATLTPEEAFDRNWTLGLIEHTVADLRLEYENSGRGPLFAALGPLAWGEASDESLAARAAQVGLNARVFAVALHRLRRRLGERLRARIADTLSDHADVDAEVHHLIAALRDRNPA